MPSNMPSQPLVLSNVLHVPDITKNLLSISKFLKENVAIIEFHADGCLIKDVRTSKILLRGVLRNGLYQLDVSNWRNNSAQKPKFECHPVSEQTRLCHNRLGHPCDATLKSVLHTLNIHVVIKLDTFCDDCKLGKMHQKSFVSVTHTTSAPF